MIDLISHTRDMLVEKIMALIGRGSPDPIRYRRVLYGMEISTLSKLLKQLEEAVFHDVKISPVPTEDLRLAESNLALTKVTVAEGREAQSTDSQLPERGLCSQPSLTLELVP